MKHKMKKTIPFILFCFIAFRSISQDTLPKIGREIIKNRISFTVNVLPVLINELSLYVDYCYKERHSIGVNVGRIYKNRVFEVNVLSGDQGVNPGTVWNGWVSRINYKVYYSKKRKQFAGVEFIYKSLSYSNQSFSHGISEGRNVFVRNEKAEVYGADLLYGQRLTPANWIFNVELVGGIGFRVRDRRYTTISSINNNYHRPLEPLGSFRIIQAYPYPFVAIKVGINIFPK
jgi:hypothetical protein